MEVFILYLIGWLIFSICYYIYNVYIDKDVFVTKKLILYHSLVYGLSSWLGILCMFTLLITLFILSLHEWIENKLSE